MESGAKMNDFHGQVYTTEMLSTAFENLSAILLFVCDNAPSRRKKTSCILICYRSSRRYLFTCDLSQYGPFNHHSVE